MRHIKTLSSFGATFELWMKTVDIFSAIVVIYILTRLCYAEAFSEICLFLDDAGGFFMQKGRKLFWATVFCCRFLCAFPRRDSAVRWWGHHRSGMLARALPRAAFSIRPKRIDLSIGCLAPSEFNQESSYTNKRCQSQRWRIFPSPAAMLNWKEIKKNLSAPI